MPRKKKEIVDVEKVFEETMKAQNFGTGMTRVNNMLMAGYTLKEIMEEKKNE